MKVIFLDIDGVLNSRSSYLALETEDSKYTMEEYKFEYKSRYLLHYHTDRLDDTSIGLLNFILREHPDAKIVFHSTWGKMFDLEDIKTALKTRGIMTDRFIGVPPHKMSSNKCHEVKWWIDDFKEENPKDKLNYVIIENDNIDPDSGTDQTWFGDRLVIVDDDEGLSYKSVIKIMKLLDPDYEEPRIIL